MKTLFKFAFLLLLLLFDIGCSDSIPIDNSEIEDPVQDPDATDPDLMDPNLQDTTSTCDTIPFGISLTTPNVTFQSDSSTVIFNDGPIIQGRRLGHLAWDYPGWMGSTDITFEYPNAGLDIGSYEVVSLGAVLDFDGTGGTMLVCPCDSLIVVLTHVDKTFGYCCGTVKGVATNQDNELVELEGSFRAALDGS